MNKKHYINEIPEDFGFRFKLNPLTISDIQNRQQRIKFEIYPEYKILFLKSINGLNDELIIIWSKDKIITCDFNTSEQISKHRIKTINYEQINNIDTYIWHTIRH
jgi:Mg2+ and Co2+ transporter CorA